MINLSEIKTVFLCAGIVFASVALCESAAELEKEGDRYNKTWGGGDYNIAQDRYWRAAALGAEDVIHKLDDLYTKGWRWYDLRKNGILNHLKIISNKLLINFIRQAPPRMLKPNLLL